MLGITFPNEGENQEKRACNPEFQGGKLENDSILELCHLLSQRIRRNALLLTDQNDDFGNLLRNFLPEIKARDIAQLNGRKGESFRKAILFEVLENCDEKRGTDLLQSAWDLIKDKGHMIVIASNEELGSHAHQIRLINRKKLEKLLIPFGKPRLMKGQPLKWIMMSVGKNRPETTIIG